MSIKYDKRKKLACLLGSPVAHSISPRMHNYSFEKVGVDAEYIAIDVKADGLAEVIEEIKASDFLGANVTMPLKNEVIKYLDKLDISSQLAGAVNTIVPINGQLVGYTTDGAGFIDSLKEIDVNVKDKNILILGAGGAATSVIVQCALDGAKSITIAKRFNKTLNATKDFAQKVSDKTNCNVSVIDIEDNSIIEEYVNKSDILINATPIGMIDNSSDKKTLIDKKILRSDLIVCDLIYEPSMTQLLIDAKDVGCKYINGKYMLLYQGARSFKLWTNKDMPVDEVKKLYF